MSPRDSHPASDAVQPLGEREVKTIVVGVLLAVFLAALDQTIVATALPAIAAEFRDAEHLSWVMSGYLLTATAATPIYGKLGDLYGRRILLTISILIFATASALSGFAGSLVELIGARALQGLGAGGLITLAQAAIGEVVAPRERGKYQAYFAVVFATSSVGGPVVGGLFVDILSWRWIFWMNLPIALAALALCHFALRGLRAEKRQVKIDYLGAMLMVGGVGALMIVLVSGGNTLPWTSPLLLGIAAAGVILLILLAICEQRATDPILPPQLFANPVFRAASVIIFFAVMAMMGSIAFLPLYLQIAAGVSASSAGLLLIPMTLAIVVGSTVSGRFMMKTGHYKPLPVIGMALAAIGYVALGATADVYTPAVLIPALAAAGTGTGMVFPVVTISVQNAVPLRNIGTATAATGLARMMGGAIGVAALGAILAGALAHITEMIAQVSQIQVRAPSTPLKLSDLAPPIRAQLLADNKTAYMTMFYVCAAMSALAFVAALLQKEMPLRTTRGDAPQPLE